MLIRRAARRVVLCLLILTCSLRLVNIVNFRKLSNRTTASIKDMKAIIICAKVIPNYISLRRTALHTYYVTTTFHSKVLLMPAHFHRIIATQWLVWLFSLFFSPGKTPGIVHSGCFTFGFSVWGYGI